MISKVDLKLRSLILLYGGNLLAIFFFVSLTSYNEEARIFALVREDMDHPMNFTFMFQVPTVFHIVKKQRRPQ